MSNSASGTYSCYRSPAFLNTVEIAVDTISNPVNYVNIIRKSWCPVGFDPTPSTPKTVYLTATTT
jgi:hypothetical protein